MAQFAHGKIVEADEKLGSKILSAGFGRRAQGGIELFPLEAAYLCEKRLLSVSEGKKTLGPLEILEKMKINGQKEKAASKPKSKKKTPANAKSKSLPSDSAGPEPAITPLHLYVLYRSLRGAGNVVRFSLGSPLLWRLYAKGVGREHERPQSLLRVVSSEWSASLQTLERELAVSRLMRLELLLGYAREGKPYLIKISKPPIEV